MVFLDKTLFDKTMLDETLLDEPASYQLKVSVWAKQS
jgi:hypothetical protein